MYSVSDKYKRAVLQRDRVWALDFKMTLDSGDVLDIAEEDIALNTLIYKDGATCTDSIQTGSTFANSLNFSLMNDNHQFSNYNFEKARLVAKIGLQVKEPSEVAVYSVGGGQIELPIDFQDTDIVEIHIPRINTDVEGILLQDKNNPTKLCLKITPNGLVCTCNGYKGTLSTQSISNGIKVQYNLKYIDIYDYSTNQQIFIMDSGANIITSDTRLSLFDTNVPNICSIESIDIGDRYKYVGVDFGSYYYNEIEAPANCFWETTSGEYFNPDIPLGADILSEGQTSFEYVPLGIFNVVTAGKKLSTIPFECMDDMYKTNRALSSLNITYPTTLLTLFDLICINCGISSTAALRNEIAELNLPIEAFDQGNYTCRDILGFIGIILGKNMRISRSGLLEHFWYTPCGISTNPNTRIGNSTYEDLQVGITGVTFIDWQNNAYTLGSTEYVAQFGTNPLLQSKDVVQSVASINLQNLSSIVYNPCNVTYIGNPAIQAGDMITHIRDDAFGSITVPVMLHTFKFRGTGILESVGQSPEQDRQLTAGAKKLLQIYSQTKVDLNAGMSNMQQTILNQTDLITNALGFYPKIEYNDDGSISGYYLMDTPEDSDTTTVWAFTSGGIGLSHTGIAGPYTSSWTRNDSIVAHVITADMIRTGVLSALDNLLTIDLSNGQLKTVTDIGATTIKGNTIRVQHYNGSSGNKEEVAYIEISADASYEADDTAVMQIEFKSNDNSSYGYIRQDLKYSGGNITEVGPLIISHPKPIQIESKLKVTDAIMYDKIMMQRKSDESGNTGVDFVLIN